MRTSGRPRADKVAHHDGTARIAPVGGPGSVRDRVSRDGLTILYHIPNPGSVGADRWIYAGWKNALVDSGHRFFEVTAFDNIIHKVEETHPDIFWTAYNLMDVVTQKELLKRIRATGAKIFMRMDWPRTPEEVRVIRDEEIVDIYFDQRQPESMVEFERQTGHKYHTVADAADRLEHFPGLSMPKYQYDVVYLGARLPKKKWFFENVLLPLRKKCRVGIFGPYWTATDNVLRAAQSLCMKARLRKGVEWINGLRVTVPPQEENDLYTSAKICLNFHEREPDGSQPHYIVNQRTFKIPACGGFEICDHVPALRRYFAEDEVVMAKLDRQEWFDKIDYYLTHSDEREEIRKKGVARALRDHTYHSRVRQIVEIYNSLEAKAPASSANL